jgi:hypothetical protein
MRPRALAGEAIGVPRWSRKQFDGLNFFWSVLTRDGKARRNPEEIGSGRCPCSAPFFGDMTKKAAVAIRNLTKLRDHLPAASAVIDTLAAREALIDRSARRGWSARVRGCRMPCAFSARLIFRRLAGDVMRFLTFAFQVPNAQGSSPWHQTRPSGFAPYQNAG